MLRIVICSVLCFALVGCSSEKEEGLQSIKIGVIDNYSGWTDTVKAARQGIWLAVEEINAQGGVLGRPLEVFFRDDKSNPAEAVKAATELLEREKIHFLLHYTGSSISLALSEFGKRHKILVMGGGTADSLTLDYGHRYNFSFELSSYSSVRIALQILKEQSVKRLAIIAPQYEYGQSIVNTTKKLLKDYAPQVELVAVQMVPLARLDPLPTVRALAQAQPDAVLSALFSNDHALFVRTGRQLGFFEGKYIMSFLAGWQEELEALGSENPVEWQAVMGYPAKALNTEENQAFVREYKNSFGEIPKGGSLYGYSMVKGLIAALRKAQSIETEVVITALEGLDFKTPIGLIQFRQLDHRSTVGTWVGQIGYTAEKEPQLINVQYYGGAEYLPPKNYVCMYEAHKQKESCKE